MTGESRIRLVVVGTGLAGRLAVEAIAARPDMSLTGWITTSTDKDGCDGSLLATGLPSGAVRVTHAHVAPTLLRSGEVDAVLYAGANERSALAPWLELAVDCDVDLISVAGPTHPAVAFGDGAAVDLHERARAAGVRLASTGINPGLLMDVLPVLCSSLSPTLEIVIKAVRRSDISWWGDDSLVGYGIGRPADRWAATTPHVTMRESMQVILDALGWAVDEVEEAYRPVVAGQRVAAAGRTIEPGQIVGFDVTCRAVNAGRELVVLTWIGEFGATARWEREGKRLHELTVEGDTSVRCSLEGDFMGDSYPVTIGRALNSLRPLRSLPPGLYRPDQLPLAPLPPG